MCGPKYLVKLGRREGQLGWSGHRGANQQKKLSWVHGQTTPEPLDRLLCYARLAARLVLFLPVCSLRKKHLWNLALCGSRTQLSKFPVGQLQHSMAKLAWPRLGSHSLSFSCGYFLIYILLRPAKNIGVETGGHRAKEGHRRQRSTWFTYCGCYFQ